MIVWSVPFFESRCKINFNGWPLVSWLFCNWVRIISINYIIWEVHNYNLWISSLTSWSNLLIDHLRCNFTIVRLEMTSETSFIINISFPYHTLYSWMICIIVPVSIIINIKLSFSVLNESISVVYTWANTEVDWTCTISV